MQRSEPHITKLMQYGLLAKGYKLPNYGADGDWGTETQQAYDAYVRDVVAGIPAPADGPAEEDEEVVPIKSIRISQEGRMYYATVDSGERFFVGKRVSYGNRLGLMNTVADPARTYQPEQYESTYGFWAYFIQPISQCESKGSFHCLNTYDSAGFTFGFLQYAAHVPDGDFVKFLRKLLVLPSARGYFPDLMTRDGRVCKNAGGVPTPLESTQSTESLMAYLNPSSDEVEELEAIQAAKFVHWSINDADHRSIQIECGIQQIRSAMRDYSRRYALDGVPDKVCLVVTDIRHQGRAKSREIIDALDTGGDNEAAYENLLTLGEHTYQSRLDTLRASIDELVEQGILGVKRYDAAQNEFV